MCLQIVHSAMREWGGQGTHRYFLRLQATWLIPMRFTENIYMTCIRNSFWRTEWFQRLSLHSDRQNVPAHGETPHVSSPGTYICSAGTKQYSENQIESMKAWVDYIRRIDGDHHGWRQVFHYGDWLALDRTGAAANSVYGATDEAYIADIYYAASAQIVAKAAEVLGLEETRQEYQKIADRQWQVVKEEYFTATGRCAVKTQTGLILALKYHLSENEELTKQMLQKLLRE